MILSEVLNLFLCGENEREPLYSNLGGIDSFTRVPRQAGLLILPARLDIDGIGRAVLVLPDSRHPVQRKRGMDDWDKAFRKQTFSKLTDRSTCVSGLCPLGGTFTWVGPNQVAICDCGTTRQPSDPVQGGSFENGVQPRRRD